MAKFELTIEHGRALSSLELREIIEIIDLSILGAARFPATPYPWLYPYETPDSAARLPFSFVEIESVRQGSIILIIATASVSFALGAIGLGIRRSLLGSELVRLGENVGDILSVGVEELNKRLEGWSETNLKLRDRKTRVRLRKLEGESPQAKSR